MVGPSISGMMTSETMRSIGSLASSTTRNASRPVSASSTVYPREASAREAKAGAAASSSTSRMAPPTARCAAGWGLGRLGGVSLYRLVYIIGEALGKQDAELRAGARLAVAEHIAARLLDDAVDHRQAEAGAFADLLGSKERFEDLGPDLGRNRVTCVIHLDQHVIGGGDINLFQAAAFAGRKVARAQRDLAAVVHGVARIDDEIDDHLLELVEVGLHLPQVAPVDHVELDRLADQPAQQHLQF